MGSNGLKLYNSIRDDFEKESVRGTKKKFGRKKDFIMTKQVKRMKKFLYQEIKNGLKILYVNYGKKEIK